MSKLARDIRQFLENGYYAEGVAIVLRCPDVKHTVRAQFQRYMASPFVPTHLENSLRDTLKMVLARLEFQSNDEPEPGMVKTKNGGSGGFWGPLFAEKESVPQDIWDMYQRAINLHKQHSHYHALLCEYAAQGQIKKTLSAAVEIMEVIIPALDKIYDSARAWEQTGKLPSGPARSEVIDEISTKMKQAASLKESIRKMQIAITRGRVHLKGNEFRPITAADIAKYEAKILNKQAELNSLINELDL
jgi:hypothetical protein